MTKIVDLIKHLDIVESANITPTTSISGISISSKEIKPGDMFVALIGTLTDGHNYINDAVTRGASVVLCSDSSSLEGSTTPYIKVRETSTELPKCAKHFYSDPTSSMKLVGITGTNGKTSTATMLHELFTKLGYKCGLVSTITYIIDQQQFNSTHTTPDSITLNRMFAEMVSCGCQYCFMEVSSHAIAQHRTDGLEFDVVLFTNITHDHLDYHKSFEEYIKTKKRLFDNLPKSAVALYNADDRNGSVMVQNSQATIKSYSLNRPTYYRCRVGEEHLDGMLLELDRREIWVKLIGVFNAYNILSVYSIARELGEQQDEILTALSSIAPVRGRFETIPLDEGSLAVVDYAHTPDALNNVLDTIRDICKSGNKLYTVVGCGGDRDKTKRPIMASIAVKKSDFVILTSDNPRTEEPEAILADMVAGLTDQPTNTYTVIPSRSEAIKMAMIMAAQSPKSVVLVAGKGHETYQEVNGVRTHFDDKELIIKNLNR